MANRILLASSELEKPVVSGARMYKLSVMRFGVYGRNFGDWFGTVMAAKSTR
jgi:hypothetical protein